MGGTLPPRGRTGEGGREPDRAAAPSEVRCLLAALLLPCPGPALPSLIQGAADLCSQADQAAVVSAGDQPGALHAGPLGADALLPHIVCHVWPGGFGLCAWPAGALGSCTVGRGGGGGQGVVGSVATTAETRVRGNWGPPCAAPD